jgi:hypothetical protein
VARPTNEPSRFRATLGITNRLALSFDGAPLTAGTQASGTGLYVVMFCTVVLDVETKKLIEPV